MDARSLRVLELDKVLARLAAQAQTHLGKQRCLNLRPRADESWMRQRLAETSEARLLLAVLGDPPLGGVTDLHEVLARAGAGSILAPPELLAVADLARASQRLGDYFRRAEDEIEPGRVVELGLRLPSYPEIEEAIGRCLTADGEVTPDASAELSRLLRRKANLRERLRQRMEGLAQEYFRRGIVQEPLVVERGGRWCLPVLSHYQSRFEGVVHDRSSSGVTVFMEPLAVVPQGNELRDTELAIREEQERILAELSALVGQHSEGLRTDLRRITVLDFIFAKGRLSLAQEAAEPRLGTSLSLPDARHPLLGAEVVPIDFRLGEDFRTLVITGPNTGGKTVTLKTVGLLVLMAHMGLHIPASLHSQVPVFQHVFADIGDEQSLEQSLSTFSSHMTQIVKVLNRVQAAQRQGEGPLLVLLDEIGAGTDPTEGTALAQAILETLHEAGCLTAVTTHYNELKAFAFTREGMENASVEFDPKTLEPTYRLLLGQPGSSNAFIVAQRLGLARRIVTRARSRLTQIGRDFVQALEQVERTQQRLTERQQEAESAGQQLERLREQYTQELAEFQQRRRAALQDGFAEAREIVRQAQEQAGEIIGQLQAQPRHTAEAERLRQELAAERQQLEEQAAALEQQRQEEEQAVAPPAPRQPVDEVQPGQRVWVEKWEREGTILERLDEDTALVAVGSFNLELPLSDLYRTEEEPPAPVEVSTVQIRKQMTVPSEIHLRGLTVDEATGELDKYLDDAALAGLVEVRIVHGKGTGALRQGIHQYLREHPAVGEFHLAPDTEGGEGATIAHLRG